MDPSLKIRLHRLENKITQIVFLGAYFVLFSAQGYAQSEKTVRIAIIQDARSLSLKVNGPYEVSDAARKKILFKGNNLKTTVTATAAGILLNRNQPYPCSLRISPKNDDGILLNGRRFKGDIVIKRKDDSRLLAVNNIGMEDYVKGILYHEVSHYWPMEALKAQAIVCRSYAFYQAGENKSRDFDLTSDTYSQVYGGSISERARTNRAVEETTGMVLTYRGKIFPAYFHATCGGATEDASLLWNIDLAPLKGVSCGFCKDSPHFKWHYSLSLRELREELIKAGFKTGQIKDILILGHDRSSRITEIKIVSADKEIKISAKDFRNAVGPNLIRSTNFMVSLIDDDVVFQGLGWGHGVGLCQWGAYFMAKQGYAAGEILKYYYPKSDVKTLGF